MRKETNIFCRILYQYTQFTRKLNNPTSGVHKGLREWGSKKKRKREGERVKKKNRGGAKKERYLGRNCGRDDRNHIIVRIGMLAKEKNLRK